MYDGATIDALKTSLRGALLQPDDAGYEVARKVYNALIDRRPRFIVRCRNVADVIAAVKFAGKHQLLVAVRGGGNFGIVTSFRFQLHPLRTVYAGPMLWSLDPATEAMQFYRDFITQAPDDINGFFAFLRVPPGPPFPAPLQHQTMCGVVWCYSGPLAKAADIFQPIRAFGPPALDLVGPLSYPALQG